MFLNKTYCYNPASMSFTFPSQEVPKQIMLYNNSTDIQFLKHFYDTTEIQGSSQSCACSYAYLKANYFLSTPGRHMGEWRYSTTHS
jgi:hypothetical protein